MASKLLSLALFSVVFYAQEPVTVPILDWGFDFPGSAISVIGQTSGKTTYFLTCAKKDCPVTPIQTPPETRSPTDFLVGTATFVEGDTLYSAAATQDLTYKGTPTSHRATCTPLGSGIKEPENGDIHRLGVVYTDGFPSNRLDCTWTSVGDAGPTPKTAMDGIALGYKMVAITQGVEKLELGTTTTSLATPLVTVPGEY